MLGALTAYRRFVNANHLKRHTIQTASRTIAFDILLCPSVRSTNTIGISTIRNPRFHARMLISI